MYKRQQDINIYESVKPIKVDNILKQNGMTQEDFIIPIGSMIIPNLQPEAPLIAAMLEFDAEIKESVLLKERQVTLKNGSSIMYDTTAFNLTMMYGLPAVTVPENIETDLVNWELKSSKINTQKSSVMLVVAVSYTHLTLPTICSV